MIFKFILRFILIAVISSIGSSKICAQYTSTDGRFTVEEVKGCTPFTVKVTSTDVTCPCDNACLCQLWPDNINNQDPDPSNNSSENPDFSYTYTEAGVYELKVQAQTWGTGVFDYIQIEVIDNIVPEFDLTTCDNNQVNVEIQDSNFDTYEIDYQDGTTPITVNNGQLVPTYSYATAGTKNVNVRGININAADNCETVNFKSVVILPILQNAAINGLQLQSITEAQIDYIPQPNTVYHLQLAINTNTNFQRYLNGTIDPNLSSLTINDSNLDFERNYYCFRIGTYDKCSNTYTGFSNTICSIDFNSITAGNNKLNLDWSTSNNDVVEFAINRDSDSNYATTLLSTFTDNDQLICNTEYCYSIIADYSNDGSILSSSLNRCATAVSSDIPTTINDISVNISDPNVELQWDIPSAELFTPNEYQLFMDGINVPNTLTDNIFIDIDKSQECYTINYTDECLNTSNLSDEVCSIYLEYQINDGLVNLYWNEYEGWSDGVMEYLVLIESNSINTSFTSNSSSFQLPDETTNSQQISVTVQAVPVNGDLNTIASNSIQIINSANIRFPNAFVPEGINTTFNVKGRYIESIDIKIYTRWGELIVNITDKELGWDGTINNKEAIGGSYIYVAEIIDEIGSIHTRTGEVLLIRK